MEQSRKNAVPRPLGRFALCLAAAVVLLALWEDSGTAHCFQGLLDTDDLESFLLLGGLFAVGLGVEFGLMRLRQQVWAWIPLVLSAVLTLWGEMVWSGGGWDRLGASFILVLALTFLAGQLFAVLLGWLGERPRRERLAALDLGLILLTAAVLCWPRPLEDKLDLQPDWRMLVVEGEEENWMRVTDGEEFRRELRWVKVAPCLTGPELDREEGFLLTRLDGEHVLMAPSYGTPYVYRYSGPLEDFTGGRARWRAYHYPALCANLMSQGRWVEG